MSFRYRSKDTPVHALNPFCILLWVTGIVILSLIIEHPLYLALLFVATLPLVAAAHIWKEWANSLKMLLLLGVFIIFVNTLVVSQGAHVLIETPFTIPALGKLNVTLEAIIFGLVMTVRLLTMVSAFAILNFTVNPDDLLLALIKMKLPYKSVLVTSMSTRFVPTVIEDMERLTDVQRTRGMEMDQGTFFQRIGKRSTILIPLLANSLDRTIQVAEAMESRGFGQGSGRTFYRSIRFSLFDIISLIVIAIPFIAAAVLCASGYGSYQYYPSLDTISMNTNGILLTILLFLLLIVIVPLSSLKRRIDLD